MNRIIKFRVWNKQKNEIKFLNQWKCKMIYSVSEIEVIGNIYETPITS